jgi:hypothetical protein
VRVLFTTSGGMGNFNPLVPLAAALRDRRHHVAFATPARFGPVVALAGFEAIPARLNMTFREFKETPPAARSRRERRGRGVRERPGGTDARRPASNYSRMAAGSPGARRRRVRGSNRWGNSGHSACGSQSRAPRLQPGTVGSPGAPRVRSVSPRRAWRRWTSSRWCRPDVAVDSIRSTVRRLLSIPAYRERASRIEAEIAAMPSPHHVARVLEARLQVWSSRAP